MTRDIVICLQHVTNIEADIVIFIKVVWKY